MKNYYFNFKEFIKLIKYMHFIPYFKNKNHNEK